MSDAALEKLFEEAVRRHQEGKVAEAESLYREILQGNPNDADAMQMFGLLALQTGRLKEALQVLQRAVEINPGAADYHYHLGMVLGKMGRPKEALAEYGKALELEESFPEALLEMGKILANFGRVEEAVGALRRAVELQPDLAEAWEGLTDALREQGRLDEAIAAGLKGVELQPNSADALAHLGIVYHYLGKYDEAIARFEAALKIDPMHGTACANMANTYYSAWDVPLALVYYRKSVAMRPREARFHSNLLYALHLEDTLSAAEMFQEHLKWARDHVEPAFGSQGSARGHGNDRAKSRRLRVGYVSPDFRGHSVSYFIESLLENHDPNVVEVFCYSDTHNPDATTARIKPLAHQWRDMLGIGDRAAAEIVREDQIDILVDLAGHTAYHRLLMFAQKPAPIQVTYLGYPDTTGLEAMDYRLTDAYADPPGNEAFYTEELVHLPQTFLCYRPSGDFPEVGRLPAMENGFITFGSLNHLPKIHAGVIELWARILKGVPGSRILIKSLRGLEYEPTRKRMLEMFGRYGIGGDRVILRGGVPVPADHIKAYHEIDIGLDTFPYNGATTTCESLWMGVPVVTVAGGRHAGRVGVSLLSNAGLAEWIAEDAEEYARIARWMAGDVPGLSRLRGELRGRMSRSPVMDGRAFARNVEGVFRNFWVRWVRS